MYRFPNAPKTLSTPTIMPRSGILACIFLSLGGLAAVVWHSHATPNQPADLWCANASYRGPPITVSFEKGGMFVPAYVTLDQRVSELTIAFDGSEVNGSTLIYKVTVRRARGESSAPGDAMSAYVGDAMLMAMAYGWTIGIDVRFLEDADNRRADVPFVRALTFTP